MGQGFYVIGSELSEFAIKQLFNELKLDPVIQQQEKLKLYKAENLEIYVGDIFDLDTSRLEEVDAVYDRAALVALPEEMRIRYTKHLIKLTSKARQLLITFEYDQSQLPGPPFSVSNTEVREHYKLFYNLNLLSTTEVPGGLKGKCEAEEHVWFLEQPK